MQISEMLGQYNRNVTNGAEELRSAQGVQKLVSTPGDLAIGSIFEGTINQVKNGKVVLALGNGQMISARLEGKTDMKAGTSMFFQVKSNDGQTVSIRPYVGGGNAGNPVLLDALTAAQIPVTERNLTMVDAMMKEQMSIGRQSVLDMVKILNNNPNANVETIVRMVKLGLPVTENMAKQFESYLSDRHMLLNEMDLVIEELTAVIGGRDLPAEEAFALYSKVVDVMLNSVQGAEGMAEQPGNPAQPGQVPGQENVLADFVEPGNTVGTAAYGNAQGAADELAEMLSGISGQKGESSPAQMGQPLAQVLNGEQMANLTKVLQNIPTLIGNPDIFETVLPEEIFVDTLSAEELPTGGKQAENVVLPEQAGLRENLTVGAFLKALQSALAENSQYGYAGVGRLFASSEFQKLFRHVIEQQWLLKPEDLKEQDKISTLYEKMEQQIRQMEHVVRLAGGTQTSFLQAAADVRGNIEFMNQMNQIYTYIQMPLKLSGQNANGELYVYTNKKQMQDPEAELTAFLHLDLEHLGATDVSVRMKDHKVRTNFYLPDDASYALIEQHLPILEKRLKKKGYSCTITIQNEKKDRNFMENFLQREQPQAAVLHRYSFDVRA